MSDLLAVEQLTTGLGPDGPEILSAVSLTMRASEVLGLVGESGSGKSMLALSIMGLLPHPIVVRHGRVLLEGSDLLQLSGEAMRSLRGLVGGFCAWGGGWGRVSSGSSLTSAKSIE